MKYEYSYKRWFPLATSQKLVQKHLEQAQLYRPINSTLLSFLGTLKHDLKGKSVFAN